MTAKAKRCTLGRPVRICREPATYSETRGLLCDRHGQAHHNLRRGKQNGPCRCRHCTNRAEVRRRVVTITEVKELEEHDTTEVD